LATLEEQRNGLRLGNDTLGAKPGQQQQHFLGAVKGEG
jgi:hypothetical protein